MVIVIDPWEPRSFLTKLLYLTSDQRRLFRAVKSLIKDKQQEIHIMIVAAYDNIPAVKDYKSLPVKKNYTTDLNTILSIIKKEKINQIYMCGMAWDICVKTRPLGYENLHKELKEHDIEILVKDDCVICSSNFAFERFNPNHPINIDWKATGDSKIFKYTPNEQK